MERILYYHILFDNPLVVGTLETPYHNGDECDSLVWNSPCQKATRDSHQKKP